MRTWLFFAADFLLTNYPERLKERFGFDEVPKSEMKLLEIIGAQRGCLRAGGKVDLERVSTIFINELRAGILGPVSYETPEIIEREMEQVAILIAEKAEREKLRIEKSAAKRRNAKANKK